MSHSMEILAPAGDEEMLRAAVFSGADCVYLGVQGFNARSGAANFDAQALRRAVAFCHARNCGVYAALNTLALPGELPALEEAVRAVAAAGCDAVIVQDLAAAEAVRRLAPGLELHGSTQMSVHSLAGVHALAELGFSRVILARELTEQEIAEIAKESPIELEVFVHGALCVCVSGQCYMSAFLGGRSANRGACAGPCRLPFSAFLAGEAEEGTPARREALPCEEKRGGPRAASRMARERRGRGSDERAGAGEEAERHDLSLKDLSVLDALPRLAEMGVAAAKIEGRLRGPEYCALAVDSARKALYKEGYDKELLQLVFSRSGFTNAWYSGKIGKDMFGVRSDADAKATRAALGGVHELYRRERFRVPVELELVLSAEGSRLTVSDGVNTLAGRVPGPLAPAREESEEALRRSLMKTGGTPFFLPGPGALHIEAQGRHLAAPAAAALRRQLLAELLALRETRAAENPRTEPDKHIKHEKNADYLNFSQGIQAVRAEKEADARAGKAAGSPGEGAGKMPFSEMEGSTGAGAAPLLLGRFENLAGMPPEADLLCQQLSLPLEAADKIPEALRAKTWLRLPRTLFGAAEQRAARQIAQTAEQGFLGYEAGNLAHLFLCKGSPVLGGFGLNIANAVAACAAADMGCRAVTLSPELSGKQMREVAWALGREQTALPESRQSGESIGGQDAERRRPLDKTMKWEGAMAVPGTAALCYGHMPLMITRACPLSNAARPEGRRGKGGKAAEAAPPPGHNCARCPAAGSLIDRKGESFPLLCHAGVTTVHNPIPLWLADRLDTWPADVAVLYFSTETAQQAKEVLQAFAARRPAPGPFTRGLYERGVGRR